MPTVMFDFFGTVIEYSPSRTEQGYPRSSEVLREAGCGLAYAEWLAIWSNLWEEFDRDADRTGIECSMFEVFAAFAPLVGLDPIDTELASGFVESYAAEWSSVARPVDGVRAMLDRLRSAGHDLVLVTNTHHAPMVRTLLSDMDLAEPWEAVITSVEVGHRKPRPEIYDAALAVTGAAATDAIFVGDTLVPDYLGPTRHGIQAYLIVPPGRETSAEVPTAHQLRSVLELEPHVTG